MTAATPANQNAVFHRSGSAASPVRGAVAVAVLGEAHAATLDAGDAHGEPRIVGAIEPGVGDQRGVRQRHDRLPRPYDSCTAPARLAGVP